MKKTPFPVWILIALAVIIFFQVVERESERVEQEGETEGVSDKVSSQVTCEELAPSIVRQARERAAEGLGGVLNLAILKLYEIEELPLRGKSFQHLSEIPRGGKIGDHAIQQAMIRSEYENELRVYPAEKNAVLNCLAIALLKNGLRVPIHFYLLKDEDGDYLQFYQLQ